MRERGGATKLKASLARSNARLGDSEWSAEAPLEIGGSTTRARKSSTERALSTKQSDLGLLASGEASRTR